MDSRKTQNILLPAIVVLLAIIVFNGVSERGNKFLSVAPASAQIGKNHALPIELTPIPIAWGDLVTSYVHNESLFLIFQNTKKEIWIYRAGKYDDQIVIEGPQPDTLAEVSVFSRK